jgi:hypothetical protein
MAFKEEIKGSNNEELIAVIPDLPVNHATHINITELNGGESFILENICVLPMLFNKNKNKKHPENEKKIEIQLTISHEDILPFSRILVTKQTLADMLKKLKHMGVSLEE